MNYTRNYRPKRVNFSDLRNRQSEFDGFKVGVLACAWIWNNNYETDKEDMREMITEALQFVSDISDGKVDAKKANEILEEMTGIDILRSIQ